ncbi:MAG: hypothetical protein LUG93_12925 [Lachnospiraceae bacterium]|nr:hypothetical protein [Lachnospiraceae bacterium]
MEKKVLILFFVIKPAPFSDFLNLVLLKIHGCILMKRFGVQIRSLTQDAFTDADSREDCISRGAAQAHAAPLVSSFMKWNPALWEFRAAALFYICRQPHLCGLCIRQSFLPDREPAYL